jgi:hypothetical protein
MMQVESNFTFQPIDSKMWVTFKPDKLFQLYLRKNQFETLRIPGNRTPSSVLKFKSSNSLTNGAISSSPIFGTSFPEEIPAQLYKTSFYLLKKENRVPPLEVITLPLVEADIDTPVSSARIALGSAPMASSSGLSIMRNSFL